MVSSPITSWHIEGEKMEAVAEFIFLASRITVGSDYSHEIRHSLLGGKAVTNLESILKSRDITLLTKVWIVQAMIFSSSHVQMWELNHNEGWAPKNWCLQIVLLEKTPESLLDSKKIKPVNPEGNQPWVFIGRTDADAEALILWPPDVKSQLIGKNADAGKDWRQKEKRAREDEMVGWHHQLNRHEFEQTLGHSEGHWSLVCCSPRGRKESDTMEWLNGNTSINL